MIVNEIDNYFNGLLAQYQRGIDEQAQREEEEDRNAYEPTAEDKAFMKSYLSCVAVGKEEDVLEFLSTLGEDKDVFMANHIFTSIEDSWLLWQDAMKFAKTINDSKKGLT